MHLFVITSCWNVGVHISITTIFAMLDFMPDAMHHLLRILKRSPILSSYFRYMVVSSNNIAIDYHLLHAVQFSTFVVPVP